MSESAAACGDVTVTVAGWRGVGVLDLTCAEGRVRSSSPSAIVTSSTSYGVPCLRTCCVSALT